MRWIFFCWFSVSLSVAYAATIFTINDDPPEKFLKSIQKPTTRTTEKMASEVQTDFGSSDTGVTITVTVNRTMKLNHAALELVSQMIDGISSTRQEKDSQIAIIEDTEATIRNGYSFSSGIGWHKLYVTPLSWNDARKSCHMDGGQLAIIDSEGEAQVSFF